MQTKENFFRRSLSRKNDVRRSVFPAAAGRAVRIHETAFVECLLADERFSFSGYDRSVSISSVLAITSVSTTPVYGLSPYLNGIRRVSDADRDIADVADAADAAAAARLRARAAQTAAAARPPSLPAAGQLELTAQTAARATATVAIGTIATTTALIPARAPTLLSNGISPAPIQTSPAQASLTGDSGVLVQSYAAALFAAGPLAVPPLLPLSVQPSIVPVEALGRIERLTHLDVYV